MTGWDRRGKQQERGAARRGTGRPDGYIFFIFKIFYPPFLLTLLLSGYLFSIKYNNRQDGTGPTRPAKATRDKTGGIGYVSCYFLICLLYSPLFFFSLFFFSDYLFPVKHNNRQDGVGRDGTDAGDDSNT